jgi:hypothetical protein
VTNPAGLTVTAFDGLGTYTFSATGSYALDGQILSGSFSTTDSATFTYTFHEVGFTPDGGQFTLDDSGGGTLNIHADNGSSLTHSLTNALTGSDSYALTRVLNQSDAVAGSYTAVESDTATTAGTDSFTLSETQTETVNTSGAITGGSDSFSFTETGTDTSSLAGQDSENVAGAAGVSDTGTASSTGAGSGGHTDSVTGTDTLGAGGFLSSETNWFTWGGSDAESLTTSATDSDTVTAAGVGQTSSTTATETQSDSATLGETGTESFSAVEGSRFTWTDGVNYLVHSQDQGFDRGTETEGDSESNPDGSDAGGSGASFTITYTDNDPGSDFLIRSIDGTQVLTSGGVITSGSSSLNWDQGILETDTHIETDTDVASSSESGSEVDAGDSDSYSEEENQSDTETLSTSDPNFQDGAGDWGSETLGSYGLILGGSDSVNLYTQSWLSSSEEDTGGAVLTALTTETDTAAGGPATDQFSAVESSQDTSSETGFRSDVEMPSYSSPSTRTLGAGGLIVGYNLTEQFVLSDTDVQHATDTGRDSGTESDARAGETDTDSFSDSQSDVAAVSDTYVQGYLGPSNENDQLTLTIGSTGAVLGGNTTTTLTLCDTEESVTATVTDTAIDEDSATESSSEGGESNSLSSTSSESDADTASETDTTRETVTGRTKGTLLFYSRLCGRTKGTLLFYSRLCGRTKGAQRGHCYFTRGFG